MATPAEHRELSLPERVAKLEADIEFDSLPLRKLRDFMENDLILDGVTNISPGSADPDKFFGAPITTFVSSPAGSGSHRRDYPNLETNDFVVPTYPGFGSANLSTNLASGANVSRIQGVRFVAARDLTVAEIHIFMRRTGAENANDKTDAGLYNNDGSSLLGSSGMKLISTDLGCGTATWKYVTYTLTAPVSLTGGLVYVAAIQFFHDQVAQHEIICGTSHLSVLSDAIITANGGAVATSADVAKWSLSFSANQGAVCGGAQQATLPATLTTGSCAFTNVREPIIFVLST